MNEIRALAAGRAHSLRRRLLTVVLAAIALVSVLQAGTAYRTALRQADEMFDYQLQALARSVGSGLPLAGQGVELDLTFDFLVQIWGPDGVQIFRSRAAALPAQPVLGFSDVVLDGVRYRVYSLRTAQQTVQIAQNLDQRRARARMMAIRAALPVALLAPVLMLAVWWLIGHSLVPVERVRQQIAHRADDDLSPLPDAGLPEEVRPLVTELNSLFARVRAAFEAQQQFLADAAHELRSPLAALKLQAQALRRASDAKEQGAAVARLDEGIDRAIRLAGQLLALAREENQPHLTSEGAPVELQQVARSAVGEVLPQARARGIDVGLVSSGELRLRGEAEALQTLLRNLLENAVKYSPEGARVDISLITESGAPRLVVEDSGPGIAESERGRVFDRFYRAAGSSATGSGLGLAIVRAIAARHGATVKLGRSERLGGLKVEVLFPATA